MTKTGLPGTTLTDDGAWFQLRASNATRLELCLFDGGAEHRHEMSKGEDGLFEIFMPGLKAGQLYGFRAHGPWDEALGHRYDPSKLLVDPYAREISAHCGWHEDLAQRGIDTAANMPKSVLRPAWPDLKPLPKVLPRFIYEVPVRAFTMLHPAVPEKMRGTVSALAHPSLISHFKRLGCDVVQLMPIAAWADERHLARIGLSNAWGYNPVAFMAPEPLLAPGGLAEIRDTITTLHGNGLRVYLDVVFNHTGESDFGGGTLSLRGLDNASYFRMQSGVLINDTGCGNTLALDRPECVDLVVTTLRHWALQCGVDGFRYDLAPLMGRDEMGFNPQAPLLEAINNDPVLSQLVHIAEPWDIGPGGYQLGNFPPGWLEWNDHFRDDVRRFWRGDHGAHRDMATRLAGSSDIFNRSGRKPSASVNFVAAHDGFALADVVTHTQKNNYANGEENRDGNDGEVCWKDPDPAAAVEALLASLFLSRGTILLTAGDEFGRSQGGNNNAYAQDNEVTWRDWKSADMARVDTTAAMIRFRLAHAEFFADSFLLGTHFGISDSVWFGDDGRELDDSGWHGNGAVLGLMLALNTAPQRLALIFARIGDARHCQLPPAQNSMIWIPAPNIVATSKVALFIEAREEKARGTVTRSTSGSSAT